MDPSVGQQTCPRCGEANTSDANFCSRCGENLTRQAAAPAATRPASRRSMWFWVPASIVFLALLGWAVLAGFPLRERQEPEHGRRTIPVVEKRAATAEPSELVVEVREERPAQRETRRAPTRGEITESEAIAILSREVARRDYYDVPHDCLSLRSVGYSNRGYTIEVHAQNCGDRAVGVLGRWRVDTVTRQVYVQKPNGKYLRP